MQKKTLALAVTFVAAVSDDLVSNNLRLFEPEVLAFTDVTTNSFNDHWVPTPGAKGYVGSVWDESDFFYACR